MYDVERFEVGGDRYEEPDVWWTVTESGIPIEDYASEEEARKRLAELERRTG